MSDGLSGWLWVAGMYLAYFAGAVVLFFLACEIKVRVGRYVAKIRERRESSS
jgi:hypothetical protein